VGGAAAGGVGVAVGGAIGIGGFAGGAIVGGAAGATGGFINGAGMTWLSGGSLGEGFTNGVVGAGIGAGTGAILGGTLQGISAARQGNSFWTGKPLNAPQVAQTPSTTPSETPSTKVQDVLNTLEEIKADGGTITPNKLNITQELNMTIKYDGVKIDLRIETHSLPAKYGGDYVTPMRHINIDLTPRPTPPLPNNGHIILPPLR